MLQVAWDRTGKAEATVQRVSPWEMELDPAEQARRDAEAARLEELAARQARAEAKRLRCRSEPCHLQAASWRDT